jgi:hypothetical protein
MNVMSPRLLIDLDIIYICQPWPSSSKLFNLFMFYAQFLQQCSQQVGNINTFHLKNNNYVIYRFIKQITEIIWLYLEQNKSTSFFLNQEDYLKQT